MTVFLASDIVVAAPERENETSKSQLDMILLQMERQKDQIQAQERKHEEQQRKNEEQQRQKDEQQRKNEEQQRQINELQHQLKEFTKINRALRATYNRSESDIVKELKKLIHAEINGLSQCVAGKYTSTKGASSPKDQGFTDKKAVSFGRTFPRTPTVVASVAGFIRNQQGTGDTWWSLKTEARSPTTTNFELYMEGLGTHVGRLDVTWIACA